MVDQPNNLAANILPGLEVALRDAVVRARIPALPLALALNFFQTVIGLSRSMRLCRKAAGLSRGWAPELAALLGSVQVRAAARLTDPTLTDAQALRLIRAIEGLSRSVVLALPPPEKVKKSADKRPTKPVVHPVTAPIPRPRRDDYAGVGAIAVRASSATSNIDATIADAIHRAMGAPRPQGTTVIHNRM